MIKKPDDCIECRKCKFWVDIHRQQSGLDLGECRHDSPQMGPTGQGYWPQTVGEDFCFRAQLKYNTLNEDKLWPEDGSPNEVSDETQLFGSLPQTWDEKISPPEPPESPPKRIIREDVKFGDVKFGGQTYFTLNNVDGDE